MKVYIVGISDSDGTDISCVCSTKEIAEQELFKIRDGLVKEWRDSIDFMKKTMTDGIMINIERYEEMINNISTPDYTKWNNYPQDCPWLREMEVM